MMRWIRQCEADFVATFADHKLTHSAANDWLGKVNNYLFQIGDSKGESIEGWLKINSNQGCWFHGFDLFEGLPGNVSHGFRSAKKGDFSLDGRVPTMDGPRVIGGWQ